jgi:hypothetical protein
MKMQPKKNNLQFVLFASLLVVIAIASIGFYVSRPQTAVAAEAELQAPYLGKPADMPIPAFPVCVDCPFAEIKTTFANFCLKSRFLPLISLNLAKNRHRFPHSRLPSRTRYEATPKYGTIGSSSPVFGGKTIRDFKNFSANGQC